MGHIPAAQTWAKTTPKPDAKPKHRRSGSVTNISITSNDFGSPALASPGSSSSGSLKDKRVKRRTRSSLGGTEDLIKELDFLTPSSRMKAEFLTLEELPTPSPIADPTPLPTTSEAIPPGLGSSVRLASTGTDDHVTSAQETVVETVDTEEVIAASLDGAELVKSTDKGVEPDCAFAKGTGGAETGEHMLELDVVESNDTTQENGVGRRPLEEGSPSEMILTDADDQPEECTGGPESRNDTIIEKRYTMEGPKDENDVGSRPETKQGQSPVEAAAIPTPESLEESGPSEAMNALPESEKVPYSTILEGLAADCPLPITGVSSIMPPSTEGKKSAEPDIAERKAVIVDDGANLALDRDIHVSPTKQGECRAEQGQRKEVEKVSVQKRIEELERIAGGKPVHFRSQSLSLPVSLDVYRGSHRKADTRSGPLYRASLNVTEQDGLELETSPDVHELNKDLLDEEKPSVAGTTFCVDSAVHSTLAEQRSHATEPDPGGGPGSTEDMKAKNVVLHNEVGQLHVNGGSTAKEDPAIALKGDQISSVNKAEEVTKETKLPVPEVNVVGKIIPVETPTSKSAFALEEKEVADIQEYVNAGDENSSSGKGDGELQSGPGEQCVVCADRVPEGNVVGKTIPVETPTSNRANEGVLGAGQDSVLIEAPKLGTAFEHVPPIVERPYQDDEASVLLIKQPAVDPLFVDSQQDRLWEMHSQELTRREGETGVQEVRESSAQEDERSQYANGALGDAEVATSGTLIGNSQSDKCNKMDRPRTPLRSLLAEEEAAEKSSGPDSGAHSSSISPNPVVSPKSNLFRRIVSGGRGSPTAATTPSSFSPKNQGSQKPFLSSCICCSPVK